MMPFMDPSDRHERYHRYTGQPIVDLEVAPDLVVVAGAAGSGDLLEPRSGRVLGQIRFDVTLLSGDAAFWF
jgi:hypothetical protein